MANDVVQWITVNGKHIPLGAGESKEDAIKRAFSKKEDATDRQYRQIAERQAEKDKLNEDKKAVSTQDAHKSAVEELSKDKYEDGTYDISNYKPVE